MNTTVVAALVAPFLAANANERAHDALLVDAW
jgi:hypothetical protein